MLLILILITTQYAIGRQLPENNIQTSKQLKPLLSDVNNKKHIRVGDEISKSNNTIDEGEIDQMDTDFGVIPIKKVKPSVKKPKKEPRKEPKKEPKTTTKDSEKIPMKTKKIKAPTNVKKPSINSKKELNDMMNYIKKIFSEMNDEEEETVTEPGEVESDQEIPSEETNSKAITNDDVNIENNKPIKTDDNQATVTDDVNSINNKEINTEETISENSESTEIEESNAKNNKTINDEAIQSEEMSNENSTPITNEEINSENSQETINEEINAESNEVTTTNEMEEMTPDDLVTTTLKPKQIDVPTNSEAEFNKSTTKVDGDLSLKPELRTIAEILMQMKPFDYDKMAQIYQEFLSIYKKMLESINSLVNALNNIGKTVSGQNALITTPKDQELPIQPTKTKVDWKDKCFKAVPASGKLLTRNKRKSFENYNYVNKAHGVNRQKLISNIEQGYLDVETQLQCINSLTSMHSEKDMFVIGYIASTAEHFQVELLKKKFNMINKLDTLSNRELFKVFDLLENSKLKLTNIETLLNEILLRNHLPPYDQTLITGPNYNNK